MTKILFLSGLTALLLSGQQVGPFQLGTPRTEIARKFGAPTIFYAPEAQRHFFGETEYNAAVGIWSLWDVYRRKTLTNEYELRLMFGFDQRESRLHPVRRLSSVDFEIDKPAGYLSILGDLSEAEGLCVGGCLIYGTGFDGSIVIMAEHPSAEDTSLANLLYHGFDDGQPPEYPEQVGIRLYLERPIGADPRKLPSDWNAPVVRASLETMPSDAVYRFSRAPLLPVLLGKWPR